MSLSNIRDVIKENLHKEWTALSEQERIDLIESACIFIDEYIQHNILNVSKPDFHKDLDTFIFDVLKVQLEPIYDEFIEEEIYGIIQRANKIYFTSVMPRRSYKKTFGKPRINKQFITQHIDYLRNLPQPPQRTEDWYKFRYNLLTASNIWKGLSSQAYINSLIYEKCKPLNLNKHQSINTETPFHWGQKYEPVSVLIYEDKYKTQVEDFGCIKDESHHFLGASPDGINVDPKSDHYGRMLEIKNRVSESVPITGNPKRDYWIQMQFQMGVCRLNECDFLETRFIEYNSKADFDADGTFTKTEDGKQKGIFMCFMIDGKLEYFYPPLNLSPRLFTHWENEQFSKNEKDNHEWICNCYWKLEKMSCVLVLRNEIWFNKAVEALKPIWDIIVKERVEGYEHRAPVRRTKTISECERESNTSNTSNTNTLFDCGPWKKINTLTQPKKTAKTAKPPKTSSCLIDIPSLIVTPYSNKLTN